MAMQTTVEDPSKTQAPIVIAPEAPAGLPAIPSAALAKMAAAKPTDDFQGKDLMIPWLVLVQTAGGYMKRANENFIPEAREGDIIDTLSKKLGATAQVILCKYETHYTEFKPGGGKLVKQWFTDPTGYNAAGQDFGKRVTMDGNDIAPSAVYYVLRINAETGSADPMIWSLGGTQVKKSRRINSLARADLQDEKGVPFIPPIYARIFDLSSRGEQGDDGKSWAGWVAEPGGLVLAHPKFGEAWWAKAEAFREQIEKGNVRPMPPAQDRPEAGEDAQPMQQGGTDPATGQVNDRDIPF